MKSSESAPPASRPFVSSDYEIKLNFDTGKDTRNPLASISMRDFNVPIWEQEDHEAYVVVMKVYTSSNGFFHIYLNQREIEELSVLVQYMAIPTDHPLDDEDYRF